MEIAAIIRYVDEVDSTRDSFLPPRPPSPLRPDMATQWMLRPDIAFSNHGSFGAVPRQVFDEQHEWRRRIEAEPIELLGRRRAALIEEAKEPIGQFLGMKPQDFGLVTNATKGINAVLRSLHFGPGDELLTTTHVYNAVRQAMRHVATRSGASYREIDLPLPIHSAGQIVQSVVCALGPRTRLLIIDHVTSPTALVFPVQAIAAACAERGIEVLVDGAHAPGMLDYHVPDIGATYYSGNLHKWACAPKGSAFLWVRPERQADIHPTTISHHLGEGFFREFSWQGTRDVSAWLTAPRAIAFMASLGWDAVRHHNHTLAVWAHHMFCDRFNMPPRSPLDGQLLGSMATVRLPEPFQSMPEAAGRALEQRLYSDHRIEVPMVHWGGVWHLRVSCQLYNSPDQYVRLADVIERIAHDSPSAIV